MCLANPCVSSIPPFCGPGWQVRREGIPTRIPGKGGDRLLHIRSTLSPTCAVTLAGLWRGCTGSPGEVIFLHLEWVGLGSLDLRWCAGSMLQVGSGCRHPPVCRNTSTCVGAFTVNYAQQRTIKLNFTLSAHWEVSDDTMWGQEPASACLTCYCIQLSMLDDVACICMLEPPCVCKPEPLSVHTLGLLCLPKCFCSR